MLKKMFMPKAFSVVLLALFIALAGMPALADEYSTTPEQEHHDDGDWDISIGLGVLTAPEFEGSDKYEIKPVPLVNIVYKERIFLSSTEGGLGVYLIRNPAWNMGVMAGYNPGRKEKDSDLLKGMGNIDGEAEMKAFAEWTPKPFTARLEIVKGTGDVKGLRIIGSLGHKHMLTNSLLWKNSVSTTFADSDYNSAYFGITQQQSLNSVNNYALYSPGSGIKDVAFSSSLTYMFKDDWAAILMGEYKILTGPAADSPLVKAGSENQFSGGLGIIYSF